MIKAGMSHPGFAFIDCISPCVTFNNNPGSTKSYEFVREHSEATGTVDFVPMQKEITTDYEPGYSHEVTMHDGSSVHLYKMTEELNPFDRTSAIMAMEAVLDDLEDYCREQWRGLDRYRICIFGEPAMEGDWGWRFEGHHVSISHTISDDPRHAMLFPTDPRRDPHPCPTRLPTQT